jgi:hypothetical protein
MNELIKIAQGIISSTHISTSSTIPYSEKQLNSLIVSNDGKYRKVYAEYFLTIEDWREKKLKELGI